MGFHNQNNQFIKQNTHVLKCLLLSLFAFLFSCTDKTETTKAKTKTITDAVFASGYVSYSDEYWVTTTTEGIILKSFVKEGDKVHNNEDLFQLSGKVKTIQFLDAKANYEHALSNAKETSPSIVQLKKGIRQAEKKLSLDQKNYERYKNLLTHNAVSKVDFDNAKLKYENSKLNLDIQVKTLDDTRDKLNLQVINAKNQLDINNKYVSDYTLKSSTEGIVLELTKKTGELAKKGELLARIGSGNLVTKLFVAEEDINKIEMNQKTILALNTAPNQTYQAKVTKIYPSFNDKEQSFVVEVSFIEEAPKLLSGTQVQANIVIEERKNALIIPAKYLTRNNSVILQNSEEKNVEVGVKNSQWVEILNGIDKHTLIVLPNPK